MRAGCSAFFAKQPHQSVKDKYPIANASVVSEENISRAKKMDDVRQERIQYNPAYPIRFRYASLPSGNNLQFAQAAMVQAHSDPKNQTIAMKDFIKYRHIPKRQVPTTIQAIFRIRSSRSPLPVHLPLLCRQSALSLFQKLFSTPCHVGSPPFI